MSDIQPNLPTAVPSDATTVTTLKGWTLAYFVDTTSPYAIYAWNTTEPNPDGTPFWYQPNDLQGNSWPDQATALTFAQQFINERFLTPPPTPKPTPTPTPTTN